jgi:glycosyltransferase involved in cell wall biosynthesis
MFHDRRVALIMPALDEADAIGDVLRSVDRSVVDVLVVADNGSTDDTAAVARGAGALVVLEPRRGYGSACMRALATPDVQACDLIAFMDADGSDDPREIDRVLAPLTEGKAEIVIGSRVLGESEPGALTPVQRFGNWLTCFLVRRFWNVHYTDLGPFRAATASGLRELVMSDPDFGWTIEMQVKAARRGMKVVEVPVSRRTRRGGTSKVSGDLIGSYRAGKRILGYVLAARFGRP